MKEIHPTKDLKCILLVDDDKPTNFLNSFLIKKSGLDVVVKEVLNATEALEYLTCSGDYADQSPNFPQPGIILLDINMPGLSGWDFLEEYHKLTEDKKGEIVIAMLTTSLNPDDENKANEQEELSGFLKKPLTREMLANLVNKYWPGKLPT